MFFSIIFMHKKRLDSPVLVLIMVCKRFIKKTSKLKFTCLNVVRVKGLEPSRLAASASKTDVSANSTIPATTCIIIPLSKWFVNSFY